MCLLSLGVRPLMAATLNLSSSKLPKIITEATESLFQVFLSFRDIVMFSRAILQPFYLSLREVVIFS